MVLCIVFYGILFVAWRRKKLKKRIGLALLACNILASALFLSEYAEGIKAGEVTRNSYGEGTLLEDYEVSVEGELKEESVRVEALEQQYTKDQIQEIFQEMMDQLDGVILGENESRDHVEKDLNLVTALAGYPVEIQWETDRLDVVDANGRISFPENEDSETLFVTLRALLTYGSWEAEYVTYAAVYPAEKTERELWLEKVKEAVLQAESATREASSFSLPDSIEGKLVTWKKQGDLRGYYILFLGGVIALLLGWKEKQDQKESEEKRKEQMVLDYPDMISQFTMLLATGMTVRQVWRKIAEEYESQKDRRGSRFVYEEMCVTAREMQSGIPEAAAYERFGRRCRVAIYVKFGALLSQNLRKGSKGLAQILKVESIQAFENRKSMAKQKGEEAGTKLLFPMMGMLAVVMVIVIVPAFLSIQL